MIAGVILAGGAGSRIGGDKALVPFRGGVLLDAVIARVRGQVDELALSIPAAAADAYRARWGAQFPLLVDSVPDGTGPLAGVVTGLEWTRAPWLATFPCDTPFLPADIVAQLMRDAAEAPVAARSDGRLHGVCAVWPVSCLERLRTGVVEGHWRSLRGAIDQLGGTARDIACEDEAFFNINTPVDLARAEILAGRE